MLVIYKPVEALFDESTATGLRALRTVHPDRARHRERAIQVHLDALERVRQILRDANAGFRWETTATPELVESADLVLTVGGDGTLLTASHAVRSTPVLGVNSAPKYSVGYFCAATADTLPELLGPALRGELEIAPLTRVRVSIEGVEIPTPALNEVLFSHPSSAGTSRYVLTVGSVSEPQLSSGVWVATAAGSTAAIRSAGGQAVPLSARDLQWLVREPLPTTPAIELVQGRADALRIVPEAAPSTLFVDGHRIRFPVDVGDSVHFDTGAPVLNLVRATTTEPLGAP